MYSRLSDYLVNKVLDHVCRGQSFTPPVAHYLALLDSASTSGAYVEVDYTGYARVAYPSTLMYWSDTSSYPSTGHVSNGDLGAVRTVQQVRFPIAMDGTKKVAYLAAFDADVGGNLLYFAEVATPYTLSVSTGFTPIVPINGITFRIDEQ